MLSIPIRTIVLAAAAAAPFAAIASGPPAPRSDTARDARTPREAPELICRSIEIAATGDTPMVCMTAADWRRAEQ